MEAVIVIEYSSIVNSNFGQLNLIPSLVCAIFAGFRVGNIPVGEIFNQPLRGSPHRPPFSQHR